MTLEANSEKPGLMERLANGTVLCAEGYVFELERRGYVKAGPFVPEVVLDYPDAVKELHREFMLAGSDVILAFTYYAHRDKMKVVGRETDLEALNRQALRLAREVAAEGDALVAGNLCNTWVYDPGNPEETGRQVRDMYAEQVDWAVAEGADFIVAETLQHLGEGQIALELIQAAGVPAVISFTSVEPKTADGYEFPEACRRLRDAGAEVVGLNCGRGPATTMPLLHAIAEQVPQDICALPVAYHTDHEDPSFVTLKKDGREHGFPLELESFLLTRYEMAEFALQARDMGVNYIGVCCGGAPHHVRAMAEALGRETPASKYSPDLSKHAVFGTDNVVKGHSRATYRDQIERVRKK